MANTRGPIPAGHKTVWAWTAGTFFGSGLLKPGPGTWGSVAATGVWLACLYGFAPTHVALVLGPVLAATLAVVIGPPAATFFERASVGEDPGHVVIDEVAGVWIALLACAMPARADWRHALVALVLFRIFDITKPAPARQLEALHGGVGIMLDDVAAGLYALLAGVLLFLWR